MPTADEAIAEHLKTLEALLATGALPKHLAVRTNGLIEDIRAHHREKGAAKP